MSYQEEITDIPPELLSIARSIARECRNPGSYSLNFTVSNYKLRIQDARIVKLERIQNIQLKGRQNGRFR